MKILFICTHNSARSQMAEGLMRELYGDHYDAYSAGTDLTNVNPNAIRVMKEIGVDISHQRSKSISEFKDWKFDYVITVCDQARETCPFFPDGVFIHTSFKDPSLIDGSENEILNSFREVRDEIRNWIEKVFQKGIVKIPRGSA